jgi:hypothetical protein
MNTEQIENRIKRLQTYVDEGRIIRGEWTDKDLQGRERACLMAALSPEAGEAKSASACPANVMPQWLARLTPLLDDCTSLAYWPEFVRDYAATASRWHALDNAAWRRVMARVMLASLEVVQPNDRAGVVARVANLWRRVLDGDEPPVCEWAEVAGASNAAASATELAESWAAWVAWAAGDAGDAGRVANVARVADTAARAAEAAAWVAWYAYAGDAGDLRDAEDAGRAADVAAWDTIARATIDAINTECDAREVDR